MTHLLTLLVPALTSPAAPPADRSFLDLFKDPELALELLARLHPLLVHFPIALFVVAALAEILRPNRQSEKPSATAFACVTLGALMGGLAAWSGWINAELSPPSERVADTVQLHRWTGVAVAGLGLLAFFAGSLAHWGKLGGLTRVYRAAIVLAGLGVGFSAHLGATLIYGEGYLTDVFVESGDGATPKAPAALPGSTPPGRPSADPTDVEPAPIPGADGAATDGGASPSVPDDVDPPSPDGGDATTTALVDGDAGAPIPVSFESDVLPIFVRSCIECHGPRKKKGGLRLDAEEHVFGGDPDFWVIQRGDAANSELQRRIELPADDPDVMPARGDVLAEDEVALIRRWIDEGADFGGARLGEIAIPSGPPAGGASSEPAPADDVGAPSEPAAEDDATSDVEVDDPAARAAALAALEELGVRARPVAQGWNALEVDFGRRAELGDEALGELVPIAAQVTRLDLTGSGVTDAGLAVLAGCTNLEYLVLRHTAIGDAAIATLAGLPALERLNLVGTAVTDAGAERLAEAGRLRRVFVWQSRITADGVAALRAERPELEVVSGD